jgi:hypothetical protein
LELKFAANVWVAPTVAALAALTPAVGDWWYNTTDGFFYSLDIIPSGSYTTDFLREVGINGDTASNNFSDVLYDLIVLAEGIKPLEAAVNSWVPGLGTYMNTILPSTRQLG